MKIQTPTNEVISIYVEKFNNEQNYNVSDQAITNLFQKFPENKKLEDIILKISVLNQIYSTNILATFKMAKHIQDLQIDEALKSSDQTLVNKIATGHHIFRGDKEINFYSFATKYCNFHNDKEYPIYDSFVHKILVAYRKQDSFSDFKDTDLRDFPQFKQIMTDFKNRYSLTEHNPKEIDKFLWIYGKEVFPNNYK